MSPYKDVAIDDGPAAPISLEDMLSDGTPYTFSGTGGGPPVQRPCHLAQGRYLCRTVRPGVQYIDCDLALSASFDMTTLSPRCLRVSALLEGTSETVIDGRRYVHPQTGIPQLAGLGQETPIGFSEQDGQRIRMAGLTITPAFFDMNQEGLSEGFTSIRAFLDPGVWHCTLPKACALREMLQSLNRVPYRGGLGDLYRESLALGIVVELAAHLSGVQPVFGPLGRDPQRIARDARALIDADPAAIASVAKLAHDLGTNETTLRRCFKEAFGIRLFDHVRAKRLDKAREMVRMSTLQIGEIAFHCGYADPANFTHAYRRRFGRSPREDRR